jgi:hypothetical protein
MESELLRLSDLLTGARPSSAAPGPATPGFGTARRPARPSSAAAAAAEPGLPSTATAQETGVQLHSSLAKELSALDALFARWQADVAAKQRSAARDFPDDRSFSMALVVLNKRGERRRGTRTAQEFYFAPRHAAAAVGELECTRCCLHIARRQTYWVDRAAPSWSQVGGKPCLLPGGLLHCGPCTGHSRTPLQHTCILHDCRCCHPYNTPASLPVACFQADELCRRCLLCVMRGLLGEDDAAIVAEAQSILESAWSPTFNTALLDALGGSHSLLADL